MSWLEITWWVFAALALAGAAVAIFMRDVVRVVLGLGVFLVALAVLFLVNGMAFLAIAQVFVYVGGVLVVMLFAIMLVHRSPEGNPHLRANHDLSAAIVSAGAAALIYVSVGPVTGRVATAPEGTSVTDTLLGGMLPQFEVAGLLLLAALLAAVAVAGGERR